MKLYTYQKDDDGVDRIGVGCTGWPGLLWPVDVYKRQLHAVCCGRSPRRIGWNRFDCERRLRFAFALCYNKLHKKGEVS